MSVVEEKENGVRVVTAILVHLKSLLILCDKAAHLGLSELVKLCTTGHHQIPNVYLTQLMHTPSHVHTAHAHPGGKPWFNAQYRHGSQA